MKIFVTGASGFLGKNFINLVSNKKKIFCLSRKNKKNYKNIFWVKGSLKSKLYKELMGTEVIVHFASLGVLNKKITYKKLYKTNVVDSLNFFKRAIKSDINKWIVIGSSSEYGAATRKVRLLSTKTKPLPLSNYAKTKYIFYKKISELAKKNKISLKVLRLFPVYGEGEHLSRLLPQLNLAIKKNKTFVLKNSEEKRDYINVKKAVLKVIKALNFKKNERNRIIIKHIATGKSIKNKEFAFKFWKKSGGTNKLIFKKTLNNCLDNIHHCSDKKSIL